MKLLPLLAATLVLGAGLATLAPAADAMGWCTSATNKLPGADCQHLFCLYPSYVNGREYCHFSEDDIPDCGPGCLYLP
jgi:hypothetical protein